MYSITILFLMIGLFTIQLKYPEGYDIALVNNIQVLFISLIAAYVIGLIFSKFLIETINYQQDQNKILKNTQEILISHAKMESIQLLAGGFAHDFNNLLTVITGNSSLLKLDEIPEKHLELINNILNASNQARNLTNQLLTFTKHSNPNNELIFEIKNLIQSTTQFCLTGSKSKFKLNCEEKIYGIEADSNQISQVIQNLVINADQAMEKGGFIQIDIKNKILNLDNSFNLKEGKYVKIKIIDEGSGIAEVYKEKVFNLFFSTKSTGSGLGLAICKNIIQNHKGHINFKINSNKGTTFNIYLPAIEKKFVDDLIIEENRNYTFSGNILIYEDNPHVILTLEEILKKLGFTPISATKSKSFIKILDDFISKKEVIEFFILDLTIPGDLGGKQMNELIKKRLKNAKVIVSSGYSDELVLNEFSNYNIDEILKKPYYFKEVRETIIRIYKK